MRNPHLARILSLIILAALISACVPTAQGRPTLTPSPIPSATFTQQPTATYTLVPTATPTETLTPTVTQTLAPSPTSTETPTPAPANPAKLFLLKSGNITVDWSYGLITNRTTEINGNTKELSALFSFQLLDRAIHSEVREVLGNKITVFYLRVGHDFNGEPVELKLILTGFFGDNLSIAGLPADGAAYLSLRQQRSYEIFEPWKIAQDWRLPIDRRQPVFETVLLADFERLLAKLPEQVILFADHPIIWRPDNFRQAKLDMQRVSTIAARYSPFFSFDDFAVNQSASENAFFWRDHMINQVSLPEVVEDPLEFSADYLILVTP